eukprot:TRINITY_DN6169_c0_g1_i1.p1 TRINITY_DN6169_c0_g1~~TRINITY_DN6169_c0_g1_i1.p1  ORF type:complete len:382 (+),score=35.80 TRINITY_DN6169_c0_g1_i1:202-1347(+)
MSTVLYFLHQYSPERPHDDSYISNPDAEILPDHQQQLHSFDVPGDGPLTLGHVVDNFPLEGSFHFRFKFGTDEGYLWLDMNDPDATVPRYCGSVVMKVRHNMVCGELTDGKYFDAVDVWEESLGWSSINSSVKYKEPTRPQADWDEGAASEPAPVFVDPAEVVQMIKDRIQDRFNPDDTSHLRLLCQVYEAVFPGQHLDGIESVHWTTIGMDDTNPIPMLRTTHCSVLGLHCVLYLLQNYYSDAHRMIVDNTSEGGYSFMQLGLGIAYLLVQCLGFDLVNGLHPSTHVLLREPSAFEEAFCMIIMYGDARWAAGKERDLDALLRKLQDRVSEALDENPTSVIEFAKGATRSKDAASTAKEAWGKAQKGVASALSGIKRLFG